MNAAAKTLQRSTLFQGQLIDLRLNKSYLLLFSMIMAVFVSALGVIYTTNSHRSTFSQYQMAEKKTHVLQLRWGQLLLEQSSLSTPARVQTIAAEKLTMHIPHRGEVKTIRLS